MTKLIKLHRLSEEYSNGNYRARVVGEITLNAHNILFFNSTELLDTPATVIALSGADYTIYVQEPVEEIETLLNG